MEAASVMKQEERQEHDSCSQQESNSKSCQGCKQLCGQKNTVTDTDNNNCSIRKANDM